MRLMVAICRTMIGNCDFQTGNCLAWDSAKPQQCKKQFNIVNEQLIIMIIQAINRVCSANS